MTLTRVDRVLLAEKQETGGAIRMKYGAREARSLAFFRIRVDLNLKMGKLAELFTRS
jgi:hypothetical protein